MLSLLMVQLALVFSHAASPAPTSPTLAPPAEPAPVEMTTKQKLDAVTEVAKAWYDVINVRGYTQVRYNRLAETNDRLVCEQCDKSLGANNGFFVRRARVILFGDVGDLGSFYIQPDFASSSTDQNFTQLRDIYFDVNLTSDRSHRLRIGQSKVPYGFENLQSSQNRLALDRNDALNSAVSNERDIGVFYYWATPEKRKLFSRLVKDNLKGSGDYGLFGLGVYNGQTANKAERNDDLHAVARMTYPFEFEGGQVVEVSLQGYAGKFVSNTATTGPVTLSEFDDKRVAASLVVYPKPFGFQAEYTIGRGPNFDEAQNQVIEDDLEGGYVQTMYRYQKGTMSLIPFLKYQIYEGGKKHENGVPVYDVKEFESGIEWQANKFMELTALWAYGDRRTAVQGTVADEQGSRIRLQMQFNY